MKLRSPFLLLALSCALALTLAGAEPSTISTIRVLTWNIHHGEGLDNKVDLNRIARLINQERVDLAALQEVDKGTERTQRRDFPAELAALTGMTCVFSNNYAFQGGEYGNAILTRFPIDQVTNTLYQPLKPGEPRGLLQVTVRLGNRTLVFLNTHLDHRADDAERYASAQAISGILKRYDPGLPILLCGDLNDVPASRMFRILAGSLKDAWSEIGSGEGFTIPVRNPSRRIDYIWFSESGGLKVKAVRVLPSEASDHLPVLAEFEWQ